MPNRVDAIKIGIEIEYLIFDQAGKGVSSGYSSTSFDPANVLGHAILRDAAGQIEPGLRPVADSHGHSVVFKFKNGSQILPDTFTLLETVTSATPDLKVLRSQLWKMKSALIAAARKHGCRVSGAACPVSYEYSDFSQSPNATFNNAGMHIHIDAPNDRVKVKLANMVAQVIPELAALSANSPIYNRARETVVSKRLSTSKLVSAKAVEVLTFDPRNPLQNDDPQRRYRFVTQFTKSFKTIELRGFDTPMTIDWAMAIAALVQCLATKASNLFIDVQRNTPCSAKRLYRAKNYEAAVEHGLDAEFEVDPTFHVGDSKLPFLYHHPKARSGETVSALLALKRLLYFVEDEVCRLGVQEFLKPIYDAVRTGKNQASQQLEWFGGGYDSFERRLVDKAAAAPSEADYQPDSERRYFIVRQRSKGGDDEHAEMSRKGLAAVGKRARDKVVLSGPVGNLRMQLAEAPAREAITLDDDEIGVGAKARRKLAISLFDPIVVAGKEIKTVVAEQCGPGWTRPPSPSRPSGDFTVRQGFKQFGAGSIAIGKSAAEELGVEDGDTVTVAAGGGVTLEMTLRIGPGSLKPHVASLMKADREALDVEEGGSVQVRKGSRPAPEPPESVTLKVRQGFKEHGPGHIVISASTTESLEAEDGAVVEVEGADEATLSMTLKIGPQTLKRDSAGLMKADREKLGVEEGDSVEVRVSAAPGPGPRPTPGPPAELSLKVHQGFKQHGAGHVVVSPNSAKKLGAEDGAKVLVAVRPLGGPETSLALTLRIGPAALKDDAAALMKADRDKLGLAEGDLVVLRLAEAPAPTPTPSPEPEPTPEPEPAPTGEGVELTVRLGDRNDPDDPPVVRVHKSVMEHLDLADGDTAWLHRLVDDEKTAAGQVTVRVSPRCATGDAGLRQVAREKFGLEINDTIWLSLTKHEGDE